VLAIAVELIEVVSGVIKQRIVEFIGVSRLGLFRGRRLFVGGRETRPRNVGVGGKLVRPAHSLRSASG
jgi:hypothetical protein